MKFLSHPIVQGVLTVVVTIALLKFAAPYTAKIPFVGKYLAI